MRGKNSIEVLVRSKSRHMSFRFLNLHRWIVLWYFYRLNHRSILFFFFLIHQSFVVYSLLILFISGNIFPVSNYKLRRLRHWGWRRRRSWDWLSESYTLLRLSWRSLSVNRLKHLNGIFIISISMIFFLSLFRLWPLNYPQTLLCPHLFWTLHSTLWLWWFHPRPLMNFPDLSFNKPFPITQLFVHPLRHNKPTSISFNSTLFIKVCLHLSSKWY